MTRSRAHVPLRRTLLGTAAALAAVRILPVAPFARAEDLPHLSESDPTAAALKYHHDATSAPRSDRPGTPAAEQFCHNCNFIESASGEWRPCKIFPGKAVHANGWCTSWAAKSA